MMKQQCPADSMKHYRKRLWKRVIFSSLMANSSCATKTPNVFSPTSTVPTVVTTIHFKMVNLICLIENSNQFATCSEPESNKLNVSSLPKECQFELDEKMNPLPTIFIRAGVLLALVGNSLTEKGSNKPCKMDTLGSSKENSLQENKILIDEKEFLKESNDDFSEYDENSENENSNETRPTTDSYTSTTQNVNSKPLFDYIVPAISEKPSASEDATDDEKQTDDIEEASEEVEEEKENEDNFRQGLAATNKDSREDEKEDEGETEFEKYFETRPHLPWRPNYSFWEKRPDLDFTTIQPHDDSRPVSYSSVVYDPVGNSKTELSGSFYKKPLKTIPRSRLFQKEERASENIYSALVTISPGAEERSIRAPSQEEEDYDENPKYEEEEEQGEEVRPLRALNLKIPNHNLEWTLPKREISRNEEDDEGNPKEYNEKSRQQFRDKSKIEKYYEQTISTRFGEKEKEIREEDENYESEAEDMINPKENDQKDVSSESEDMTEEPIKDGEPKEDRNQFYEYVMDGQPLRQTVSENKEISREHKEASTTTEAPPEEKIIKPEAETAKPKSYSFGTITKPYHVRTLNHPGNQDIVYNQIVSNIQSLFTPTTPKPTTNYEQHFSPSHGNCKTSQSGLNLENYETFLKPSLYHPTIGADDEEEDDEEDDSTATRLPVKTYMIQKPVTDAYKLFQKPPGAKMIIYSKKYREAKPISYRNAVYSEPDPMSSKPIRKVFYYEPTKKRTLYSPTNQILRIMTPETSRETSVLPSAHRMIIIRRV